MLSRALGRKRKRGKERVTHRNFAKKYFLCTSKRHFNVSQSFSLKFCTCLSHKRKLLVCKSQLLFSVGFEIITKIEGAIFFETSCTLGRQWRMSLSISFEKWEAEALYCYIGILFLHGFVSWNRLFINYCLSCESLRLSDNPKTK